MDAMPNGGSIMISTHCEVNMIMVDITDTGQGIRKDDLPYVLDPFFTTKDVDKGTGLGLSICYGIMEMHHGSIEIKSKAGEGTTVSLLFPTGGKVDE